MQLYKEILADLLSRQEVHVTFPQLKADGPELIASASYQTLSKIREILRDNSLDDPECFDRIERIVMMYESIGSGCGTRHE